jgi:hypothetical protein
MPGHHIELFQLFAQSFCFYCNSFHRGASTLPIKIPFLFAGDQETVHGPFKHCTKRYTVDNFKRLWIGVFERPFDTLPPLLGETVVSASWIFVSAVHAALVTNLAQPTGASSPIAEAMASPI